MSTVYKIFKTSLVALIFLIACEDEKYEPAAITFYPTLAAEAEEPEEGGALQPITISLRTSRVLVEESQVNIRITGNGSGYGYSYLTSPPQLEPGIITLTVPAGEAEATFAFTPRYDGVFVPQNYDYTFSIEGTSKSIRSVGQGEFALKVLDSTIPFFQEDFTSCPGTKFTEVVASGVSTWGCSGFGYPDEAQTNNCREANAFNKGSTDPCNTYLITAAPIDGSQYSSLYVNAKVYSRFTGSGNISFKYSSNYPGTGNPEAEGVVWTELSSINQDLPAAGSQEWVVVEELIPSVPDAPIYIAIHHQGGNTTSSSSWRIDNFEIKGN